MADYERAGAVVNRLRQAGNVLGSVESEAADVIQDLMNECQLWEIRADHVRRKADELVGWLNGRWG